jgi:hypothetical protein
MYTMWRGKHFNEQELVALTAAVIAINGWNRAGHCVSKGAWDISTWEGGIWRSGGLHVGAAHPKGASG